MPRRSPGMPRARPRAGVVRHALRWHARLERLDELQGYGRRRAEERGVGAGGRRGARRPASRQPGLTLRVVIDTNVAVSALIAHGPPARVLEEAIVDGHIELLVPEVVLDELDRVLKEKLGFDEEHRSRRSRSAHRAGGSSASLSGSGSPPSPTTLLTMPTLACARVAAKAEVLVTGDRKHLLPLGETAGFDCSHHRRSSRSCGPKKLPSPDRRPYDNPTGGRVEIRPRVGRFEGDGRGKTDRQGHRRVPGRGARWPAARWAPSTAPRMRTGGGSR